MARKRFLAELNRGNMRAVFTSKKKIVFSYKARSMWSYGCGERTLKTAKEVFFYEKNGFTPEEKSPADGLKFPERKVSSGADKKACGLPCKTSLMKDFKARAACRNEDFRRRRAVLAIFRDICRA